MSSPSAVEAPLRSHPASENFAPADCELPTRAVQGAGPAAPDEPTDRVTDGPDLGFLTPSERPGSLGRLDHYEVLEVRGQGGFGIVLKAFDEKLRRVVALKVLPPILAASALSRRRFLREAQAAAAVHDDHVVAIFAVENGRSPYIVMEYVDGPSLQEIIDSACLLPVDEILRIGQQIACGLAAAHAQGMIHRDIKPSNILLENGVARVKITDFGLARAVDDVTLSQAGVVHGTPAYMAPEQANDAPVDQRADLFSLGTVLYTIATGRLPYRASSSLAMLRSVLDEAPRPMRESRPELPPWFEDLVARLHAKKPHRRYQTAREVADLLSQRLAVLNGQSFASVRMSTTRRAGKRLSVLVSTLALIFAVVVGWRALSKAEGHAAVPPAAAVAPFDGTQARLHQALWGQHLQTPVQIANSLGMTLRLVPPGEFMMGGETTHAVRITQPYFLGAYEVTVAQFRAFVEATDYKTHAECDPRGGAHWNAHKKKREQRPDIHWRTPGFPQTDEHPVCCLTWKDATAFCSWLATREGKPYRLPTEAEWEYACRAGTTTSYSFGPVADPLRMNVNLRGTTPVGAFSPNAFGMWDMHGNVYEWCLDAKRTYGAEPAIDPCGPRDGPDRVTRGGAYSTGLFGTPLRSDARGTNNIDDAYAAIGMRVLLECR